MNQTCPNKFFIEKKTIKNCLSDKVQHSTNSTSLGQWLEHLFLKQDSESSTPDKAAFFFVDASASSL